MPAPPIFKAPYAEADEKIAEQLLASPPFALEAEKRVQNCAAALIESIRNKPSGPLAGLGGVEDFLQEYSLSTKEGLSLMVLAEALLRIPDNATADKLIEDKFGQGAWQSRQQKSDSFLISASSWVLGMSSRIIQPGETPEGVLASLAKRLGLPSLRAATRQVMKFMGAHFVLGQTIEGALAKARVAEPVPSLYSFDMLGEGARTKEDAGRYWEAYKHAIHTIGKQAGASLLPNRSGISVKLSALHPQYYAPQRERVLAELIPDLAELARQARLYDLNFTIDAEEADRLELSLEVIATLLERTPELEGWDGFGLAIQAYQKRATYVIRYMLELAQFYRRRFMVRLVKGAYWDTEIKRAQERGLADYPVFTRKPMTDLNYLACAQQLLAARPHLYPQFATHNALTVASVAEYAGVLAHPGDSPGFEFQRLHGMGDSLYRSFHRHFPKIPCRIYAPVGVHQDLLAYLVRRLLENGANSSFVSLAADSTVPISALLRSPQEIIELPEKARHPNIPLPGMLYQPERINSPGLEFGNREALSSLITEVRSVEQKSLKASSAVRPPPDSAAQDRSVHVVHDDLSTKSTPQFSVKVEFPKRSILSPIDGQVLAPVPQYDPVRVPEALEQAWAVWPKWNATAIEERAKLLDRLAEYFHSLRSELLSLLQVEGGKTLDDALAEWREAVDFCTYYAARARHLGVSEILPGPTGEENKLLYRGRGVFICISPWNFPLAIFTGQIAAALVMGNCVIAKPAEQTPLIAHRVAEACRKAGFPEHVLQILAGDGQLGAALVGHPHISGVAFTGSTETAWHINRALAAKNGPIVPLIAETGGMNVMIVDATALPEQVTDDVVTSAFRSAGQRCSALRILCLQEDIADKMMTMIAGAAAELTLGDPRDIRVQVGPVIDAEAKARLYEHIDRLIQKGTRLYYRGSVPKDLDQKGFYVPPHIFEIDSLADLSQEIFGPILHVVRYKAQELDRLLKEIESLSYGLTFGLHSRIDSTIKQVLSRISAGNCYVNRNMIGAVVGTQPFGGSGLSGTGPKAGGPHYLHRFALEQVVSVNTAAAGGNAHLIATS